MEYEYRVVSIKTGVTEKDFKKGVASSKIAAQVEIQIQNLAREGFEYYRSFPVNVAVKPGCLKALFGAKIETVEVGVMVFRKTIT